jgi:hypothetical protein
VWHTWIDYPKFHALMKRYNETGGEAVFTAMDYMAPTPDVRGTLMHLIHTRMRAIILARCIPVFINNGKGFCLFRAPNLSCVCWCTRVVRVAVGRVQRHRGWLRPRGVPFPPQCGRCHGDGRVQGLRLWLWLAGQPQRLASPALLFVSLCGAVSIIRGGASWLSVFVPCTRQCDFRGGCVSGHAATPFPCPPLFVFACPSLPKSLLRLTHDLVDCIPKT